MATLHISLLGGFEARLRSGEVLALKGRKTQALVAYLALAPGEQRTRDELVALLWGDRGEQQARSSLRQSLSELRKALRDAGDSLLVAERDAVSLDADAIDVDVTEFERSLTAGVISGHPALHPITSAIGGKADIQRSLSGLRVLNVRFRG